MVVVEPEEVDAVYRTLNPIVRNTHLLRYCAYWSTEPLKFGPQGEKRKFGSLWLSVSESHVSPAIHHTQPAGTTTRQLLTESIRVAGSVRRLFTLFYLRLSQSAVFNSLHPHRMF